MIFCILAFLSFGVIFVVWVFVIVIDVGGPRWLPQRLWHVFDFGRRHAARSSFKQRLLSPQRRGYR